MCAKFSNISLSDEEETACEVVRILRVMLALVSRWNVVESQLTAVSRRSEHALRSSLMIHPNNFKVQHGVICVLRPCVDAVSAKLSALGAV
jgi:hypothetical protein